MDRTSTGPATNQIHKHQVLPPMHRHSQSHVKERPPGFESRLNELAQRYEQGRDLWTGEPLGDA